MRRHFLKYYLRADTIHNIHSPLLYDFLKHTLEDDRTFYYFKDIAQCRSALLQGFNDPDLPPISIARLFFRIALWKKPRSILCVGSAKGLGAGSLASGAPDANATILIINGQQSKVISRSFNCLELEYPEILKYTTDKGESTMRSLLKESDLLFLDARSSLWKEIDLTGIVDGLADRGLLLFYLGNTPEPALKSQYLADLRSEPSITAIIDLYDLIVVFKDPRIKQRIDVSMIRSCYKPWVAGFWPGASSPKRKD